MTSPYDDLPERAFWRSGVATRAPLDPGDLYQPRFRLTRKTPIITAGSCFAQHVGRSLRAAGYNLLDAEPLHCAVPDAVAQRYGYRQYSARYGNIYTLRQMLQLAQQAFGLRDPEAKIWEKNGRYFDALRPAVEPDGLPSPEAVRAHRAAHLAAVRRMFEDFNLFIFTLGLTEAWVDKRDGTVYPVAPGVIAGDWTPETVGFHNFHYHELFTDFRDLRALLRKHNPKARFLLTVSPVPLTATASGDHVEVATGYSKATLRALCGHLRTIHTYVDYFPSYEIITSVGSRGAYYEPNLRNVSDKGVETAMDLFLSAHDERRNAQSGVVAGRINLPGRSDGQADEVQCEEAMLEAFGK